MFASMSSFTRNVRVNGRELRVRVEQDGANWRIDTGEGVREASVVEVEPGVYSILIDGQSFEVRASETGVEIEDPRDSRTSANRADWKDRQTVSAPMPGKVVRVLVAEGDVSRSRTGSRCDRGDEDAERDEVAQAWHGRLADGDRRLGGCRGSRSGCGRVEGYGRRSLSEMRGLDLGRDRA